jgi:hypothetical protein
MNELQIEELANAALDKAVLHIQGTLGVSSGDNAAIFFSDDEVMGQLVDYIKCELRQKENGG